MSEFTVGYQPCTSFLERTLPPNWRVPDPTCHRNGCVARVRYCETCSHLHHEGGLETCPVKPPTQRYGMRLEPWDD